MMKSIFKFLVLFFIIFSCQIIINAQPISQREDLSQKEIDIDFEKKAKEAIEKVPINTSQLIEYYDQIQEYNNWVFAHTKNVYRWTLISSILIFFVVHIIIGFGLYFSYIQFQSTVIKNKEELSNSSIKVDKDGIEISSSVLGLLTLLISLVFFYLYIEKVYPITRAGAVAPFQVQPKED